MPPKNVCVIDDETSIRLSTTALVRSLGHDAHAFDSAEAYLTSEIKNSVDCIVCDVRMRGMSGTALLTQLRITGARTPFIFVSGNLTARDRLIAAEYAAAILEKPIDPDDLVALIVEVLR
ncbi:FixJ family two-component response regulator [Paraburkholderia bannensis]|uniref:FixJ family two-component response regulator n=1 Tax=Paraburkholderia bannensis TaxID=765414 RepID=A0A7W9U397_9BURK|nr:MULTISPECIES: response regulator [Paraburkholderia]MBB3262145.1 FixJ family two-component response regulator [Paraburkholderia sp. WP4_3_2]MBB6105140.1 FixJ family two-component response regulator [Paraburkholderia bannensis]